MSSIMDSEEFMRLRALRGKADEGLSRVLDQILQEIQRTGNVRTALINVYADHIDEVRRDRELFEVIMRIFEKYSPRLGEENVYILVKSVLFESSK